MFHFPLASSEKSHLKNHWTFISIEKQNNRIGGIKIKDCSDYVLKLLKITITTTISNYSLEENFRRFACARLDASSQYIKLWKNSRIHFCLYLLYHFNSFFKVGFLTQISAGEKKHNLGILINETKRLILSMKQNWGTFIKIIMRQILSIEKNSTAGIY